MKKNMVYKLLLSLNDKYDIETAKCGCKAGKGPKASCKNIRALCYALKEYCSSGQLPGFFTCTEKVQEWNKPRPQNVEITPVLELSHRKQEILKQKRDSPSFPAEYDPYPCPIGMHSPNPK
jgi:hypothetical protein